MSEFESTENLASQSFHLDNLQEGVLALGMYQDQDNATTNYVLDGDVKKLPKLEDINTGMLAEKFKKDPKEYLAIGRENMFGIMRDPGLSKEDKKQRVRRYLDAFLNLQLKLDHIAFKPDDIIRSKVPDYIPDGMTDMGSDPDPDPKNRTREKIYVDKDKIFEQSKDLFIDIFTTEYQKDTTRSDLKKYIINRVAHFIYTKMPYDYERANPFPDQNRSIKVTEAFDNKLAVCRHHAIYAQVLLQSFGVTSRLLKCNANFGPGKNEAHACNLVRVDNQWSILDSTNPDHDDKNAQVYVIPVPDKDIDTNRQQPYTWKTKGKYSSERVYTSRNNMFYKNTGENKSF